MFQRKCILSQAQKRPRGLWHGLFSLLRPTHSLEVYLPGKEIDPANEQNYLFDFSKIESEHQAFTQQEEKKMVCSSVQQESAFLVWSEFSKVSTFLGGGNHKKYPEWNKPQGQKYSKISQWRFTQASKWMGDFCKTWLRQSRYTRKTSTMTLPLTNALMDGFCNSSFKMDTTESVSTMLELLLNLRLSKPHNWSQWMCLSDNISGKNAHTSIWIRIWIKRVQGPKWICRQQKQKEKQWLKHRKDPMTSWVCETRIIIIPMYLWSMSFLFLSLRKNKCTKLEQQ